MHLDFKFVKRPQSKTIATIRYVSSFTDRFKDHSVPQKEKETGNSHRIALNFIGVIPWGIYPTTFDKGDDPLPKYPSQCFDCVCDGALHTFNGNFYIKIKISLKQCINWLKILDPPLNHPLKWKKQNNSNNNNNKQTLFTPLIATWNIIIKKQGTFHKSN